VLNVIKSENSILNGRASRAGKVLSKETLAIRVGCGAVATTADLIVSCNAETLTWRNGLVFKAMWSPTMKNADALHCKELQKILIKM
jgi:hypothetical protein